MKEYEFAFYSLLGVSQLSPRTAQKVEEVFLLPFGSFSLHAAFKLYLVIKSFLLPFGSFTGSALVFRVVSRVNNFLLPFGSFFLRAVHSP